MARQEMRKCMLASLAAQATELARFALAPRGMLLGANGGLRLLSTHSCTGPPLTPLPNLQVGMGRAHGQPIFRGPQLHGELSATAFDLPAHFSALQQRT